MKVAGLNRESRQRADITPLELARGAGTTQLAVAAYESGAKTPNLGTLQRLLAATGHDIEVLAHPRVRRGAASLAELSPIIKPDLEQADEAAGALRLLFGFADDFRGSSRAGRLALLAAEPPLTGGKGTPGGLADGAVKGFMPGADKDPRPLADIRGIEVTTASPRYLLAMKLMAMRFGEDDEDIEILLERCGLSNAQEVLDLLKEIYPLGIHHQRRDSSSKSSSRRGSALSPAPWAAIPNHPPGRPGATNALGSWHGPCSVCRRELPLKHPLREPPTQRSTTSVSCENRSLGLPPLWGRIAATRPAEGAVRISGF